MHADLSRTTFRPERHYSAVLSQQGRVQLDADANEQAAIDLHRARTTAADLIGPHGAPAGHEGFAVEFDARGQDLDDLKLSWGRYYVDGILVDSDRPSPIGTVPDEGAEADSEVAEDAPPEAALQWTYWDQPDAYRNPENPADRLPSAPFLAYLKIWERSVTAAEDPSIREVALGSALPDTAARVRTVWQVLPLSAADLGLKAGADAEDARKAFDEWTLRQGPGGALAARAQRPEHADDDPCLARPDARYRGPENQLYRVEIHDGGRGAGSGEATFVWSRENGSVVFPVDGLDGTWVDLAHLGGDAKLDVNPGDWVEFCDSAYVSRLQPKPLLRVEEIDLPRRRVRLSGEPGGGVGRHPERHPFLRRWDHRTGSRTADGTLTPLRGGAVPVEEGRWLHLEEGVEVYFGPGGRYRTGDHWLIPARTATGTVEWPADAAGRPYFVDPAGIDFHFAPLAWITADGVAHNLRRVFQPLAVSREG
ncbi:DUF6519 domain-containing protein [Streptomyces boninensis]|uniref:DUF6519 domain-containing protein n=1 Tax=Streptomyces boninensis TaxID=2039455 RepID=UPI003B2194EC